MARLSNTAQLSLGLDTVFNNRGLFADHFLEQRLREMNEWTNASNLDATFQTVLKLYRDKGAKLTAKDKESQVEDDWIKPVLNELWTRDCYQIQPALPNPDKRGIPDYAL